MSELKTRFIDDTYFEYFNTGKHELSKIYLKSEADEAIADLEESHKKEVGQLLMEIVELKKEKEYVIEHTADVINGQERELSRQKYKRCLAMAQVLEHVCPMTNRKAKWRDKWHKRRLKIAEKFKTNSTAQHGKEEVK